MGYTHSMEYLDYAKHILHRVKDTKWKNPLWTRLLTESNITWSLSYVELSFQPFAEFVLTDTDGTRYWIAFTAQGVHDAGIFTDALEKETTMRAQRRPLSMAHTQTLRTYVHEELRKAGYNVV